MYKKSAHKIWVKLTPRTCIVAIIPSFFWRQHFFLKWWQILLCRHVCGNFCQNVGHRCCRQLLNDSYLEKDRRTVYKNRFDMKYFRIQWLIIIAKNLFFGSFRTRVHGSNPTWSDILVTKTKKTSRFYYDNNVCPLRLDSIARGCVPKQRSLCARRPRRLRARVRACQTRKQSSVERRSLAVLIICSEISLKQKICFFDISDSQPGSSEHLVSISSTFKAQLFRAQIPKV